MIGLIAFDIDGTLVDSAAEIADTVNDVLSSQGLGGLPTAIIRDWIGLGAREVVRRAYARQTGLDGMAAQGTQLLENRLLDTLMDAFAQFHAERCGTRSRCFPRCKQPWSRCARCR